MVETYLNAVENYKYRRLMRKAGIKNGCLNYLYAKRSKKTDWDYELSFLDKLIVDPGVRFDVVIDTDYADEYVEFLNEHEEIIDFAFDIPQLGSYVESSTDVPIVPFFQREMFNILLDSPIVAVTGDNLETIFFNRYLKEMKRNLRIHGYCFGMKNFPYVDSVNTIEWILGKYGYTYSFYNGDLVKEYKRFSYKRSYYARKLILEGYDIDIQKVLKEDVDTLHFINLIAFAKYQDWGDYVGRN